MNVRCMWLLLGLCCTPAALWSQGDEERQAERWIVHVAGDPLRLGPLRTAIRESRPPDGVTDIITACQARVDRDRQALLDDVKALGGRVVANWWLIDAVAVDMPPGSLEALRSFILPGGMAGAAHLHLARTIVRRAERSAVAASAELPLNPLALAYLNRLSDFLFVAARHLASRDGGDILWKPGATRDE